MINGESARPRHLSFIVFRFFLPRPSLSASPQAAAPPALLRRRFAPRHWPLACEPPLLNRTTVAQALALLAKLWPPCTPAPCKPAAARLHRSLKAHPRAPAPPAP